MTAHAGRGQVHARNRPRAGIGAAALALALGAVGGVAAGVLASVQGETADAEPTAATATVTVTASAEPEPASEAQAAEPLALADVLPVQDIGALASQDDVDGLFLASWSIDEPTSPWVVVNKARPLEPLEYEPEDLVAVDGVPGGSSEYLREEAADALAALHDGAVEVGLDFTIASAYRSYSEQVSLHATYVSRRGSDTAEHFSARAGYSEHQAGWAVDIYGSSTCRVKRCFADEPIGQWVAENAWQYGWIVRYPKDEHDTTGYWYEPWHLRYVGVELSTWMHEQGIVTLEDAFDLEAAVDYPD